ncbi:monocarboxylate transporter 3-like isoform X2 [Macrobrachium nipponense]|uniref:monocarboxylate transporter 3-like isoform X2 n=1 Tax=Macrobrachium nipponense TaxID=159736 RepID=UPI0030C883F3
MTFGFFLPPRGNPTEFAVLPESVETAALKWERIESLKDVEDNWSLWSSKEAWRRHNDAVKNSSPPDLEEEKSGKMKEPSRDSSDFGLVAESIRVDGLDALFPEKVPDVTSELDKEQVEAADANKPTQGYEPPDGGWRGWSIVCANAVCAMMFTTQGPCFGFFFGPRLRELGATATLTAWIFCLQSLTRNLTGPWAGLLGSKFGYRPVAMISALTAASSFMVSALVSSNPLCFLLTFSLLSGLGAGICMNSCYHISAQYFKKRLGLANGIMVTGGSLGFVVMPLLGAELQERFSFKWATIIAGCVFMLAVPGTAFFQPIELYMKKKKAAQDQEEGQISEAGDGCKDAEQEKEGGGGIWKKFLQQFKPSVFRDPLVVTTALFTCLSITILLNIVALVPFLLNDAGYNLQDASWPVSVAAFTDMALELCVQP